MDVVNCLSCNEFIDRFANIVEHTPKVAEILEKRRPFQNLDEFYHTLEDVLKNDNHVDREEILRKHPDLAGKLSLQGLLTQESKKEQLSAGLSNITEEERSLLTVLNNQYRMKFGFTFIVCARENKLNSILTGLQNRLKNNKNDEVLIGMREVKKIAKLRTMDIIHSLSC